uniref:Uncharacterized protein n=1 Tax=Anopheles albimanus TaxID=7167 RepID=A0A182FQV2_ANOAL
MSEMISVKLLNQYHTRSFAHEPDHFGDGDHDVGREPFLDDVPQPPLAELGYETVNQLDLGDIGSLTGPQLSAVNAEPVLPVHFKENGIEDEFLIKGKPAIDQQLIGGNWMDPVDSKASKQSITEPQDDLNEAKASLDTGDRSIAPTTSTMTVTTTRTVQSSTITVRKVRRKVRRKLYTTSSPSTVETERPLPSYPLNATPEPASTTSTSSIKPTAQPKIDITKLNLQHLEDEFLAYPTFGRMHPSRIVARLRPRSMKRSTDPVPASRAPASGTCSCRQSRKRRARKINYSYDVGGEDDDENELNDSGPGYEYGDYNELRRSPADVAHLFPVVSHLLAQEENGENSMERAQVVHGALERLMGIVTIFSHVDELIQRRTKKSIRRLARLYESDEMY